MELRRKFVEELKQWKKRSNGKSAVLIEGARRVGKSYTAQVFAKECYQSYLLIDFANVSKSVTDIFSDDSTDLDLFFNKLSAFYGKKLYVRESLIIFDEIQLFPKARQLIKYLVADGRYDFLETGSLISLKQNVHDIVIPSEEDTLVMHPLDFEEFLWAMGNETLFEFIDDCLIQKKNMGAALHKKAMDYFRQYMLVGGMPQSVVEYIQTKDFENVDRIKRRILKLYRDDISKFAKGYESKVISIFDGISSQLSKHEKKFSLASLSKNARLRNYEDSFIWLSEAKVVNICFNSNDPHVGLSINSDQTTLKCYMADTGLLFSHAFSETDLTANEVYKAILFDKLNLNEGMFFENIVSQMFVSKNLRLFFYSRSDNENSANRMEIDFLLSDSKKIIPVEVKSSVYQKHTSLDKFSNKFSSRISSKIIIYTKDFMTSNGIDFIPVYAAENLAKKLTAKY